MIEVFDERAKKAIFRWYTNKQGYVTTIWDSSKLTNSEGQKKNWDGVRAIHLFFIHEREKQKNIIKKTNLKKN